MKVNVTIPIIGLDDLTIKQNGENLTVRTVLINSILKDFPEDSVDNSASEKLDRFELAMRIRDNDSIDLSETGAVKIGDRVARCYATIAAAQVIKQLK